MLISGITDLRGITASVRHVSALFQRRYHTAISRISLRIPLLCLCCLSSCHESFDHRRATIGNVVCRFAYNPDSFVRSS